MTKKGIASIRKLCSKPIVVGGIHPSYFPEYVLNTTEADFVMCGDGDESIISLMNAIKGDSDYNQVKGLCWRGKHNTINKNEVSHNVPMSLEIPAYDLMPGNVYTTLPIDTSRGCKFNCEFCSILGKKNWRSGGTDEIINRATSTMEQYGNKFTTNQVYITDDCFTADPDRAKYILSELHSYFPEGKFKHIINVQNSFKL